MVKQMDLLKQQFSFDNSQSQFQNYSKNVLSMNNQIQSFDSRLNTVTVDDISLTNDKTPKFTQAIYFKQNFNGHAVLDDLSDSVPATTMHLPVIVKLGIYTAIDPLDSTTRIINTSKREDVYFNYVQLYQQQPYSYFSLIDNTTVEGTNNAKVRVYATNYNVLRVMSGMAGLNQDDLANAQTSLMQIPRTAPKIMTFTTNNLDMILRQGQISNVNSINSYWAMFDKIPDAVLPDTLNLQDYYLNFTSLTQDQERQGYTQKDVLVRNDSLLNWRVLAEPELKDGLYHDTFTDSTSIQAIYVPANDLMGPLEMADLFEDDKRVVSSALKAREAMFLISIPMLASQTMSYDPGATFDKNILVVSNLFYMGDQATVTDDVVAVNSANNFPPPRFLPASVDSSSNKFWLNFNHPCKELVLVVQSGKKVADDSSIFKDIYFYTSAFIPANVIQPLQAPKK